MQSVLKKMQLRNTTDLAKIVFRFSPFRFIVSVSFVVLAAFSEIFGLSSLAPLSSILLNPSGQVIGAVPFFVWLQVPHTWLTFSNLTCLVVVGVVLRGMLLYQAYFIVGRIAARLERVLANSAFRSFLSANWYFWLQNRPSIAIDATGRLTRELNWGINLVTPMLAGSILSTLFFVAAFTVSPSTVLAAGIVGIPILLTMRSVSSAMMKAGESLQNTITTRNARLIELFQSLKFVKACGYEQLCVDEISDRHLTVEQNGVTISRCSALISSVPDTLAVSGICAIILTTSLIAIDRIELVLMALLLIYRGMQYGNQFISARSQMIQYLPSIRALDAITKDALASAEIPECADIRPLNNFKDSIQLQNVNFGYPDGTQIFTNLNLTIKMGEKVHIRGPSGSGKSTFLDLLLGLLSPQSGTLLVDDIAMAPNLLTAWRQQIAFVPQEAPIFSGTLKSNLYWGVKTPTDNDLWHMLERVQLKSLVERNTRGLDAPIDERGLNLSGGQKQRLAIARALLMQRPIIILDEATSSVDAETASIIYNLLAKLESQFTIILVSHQEISSADIFRKVDLKDACQGQSTSK